MRARLRWARFRRLAGTIAASALVSLGATVGLATVAHADTPSVTYTFGQFGTLTVNGNVTDQNVLFSTYAVDPSAPCDGSLFDGKACVPQTIVGTTQHIDPGTYSNQVFTTGATLTCGYGQADVYSGVELTTIGPAGNRAKGDDYIKGVLYTLGPACGSVTTPTAPTMTASSCTGTELTLGTITVPAGYVVTDSSGKTVTDLTHLTPGTYTVTTTAPSGKTFSPPGAGDTYTLSSNDTVATWTATITGPASCVTTTTHISSPPAPTGKLVESCPTEATGTQTYVVTLNNTVNADGTPSTTTVEFRVSVSGKQVGDHVVAPGGNYQYNGTLPNGSAAPITADYSTDSGTTWTAVDLSGSKVAFPCVLGEQFTQAPPPSVEPVTVVQEPTATLPFTGLPTLQALLVSVGLIAAGTTLLVASRRRAGELGRFSRSRA